MKIIIHDFIPKVKPYINPSIKGSENKKKNQPFTYFLTFSRLEGLSPISRQKIVRFMPILFFLSFAVNKLISTLPNY